MIDELRYHDPHKDQIITKEVARAAADELDRLRAIVNCPIGLGSDPILCSAGSCHVCLSERAKWHVETMETLKQENEDLKASLGKYYAREKKARDILGDPRDSVTLSPDVKDWGDYDQ